MKIVSYNIHKGMNKDKEISLKSIINYLKKNDFDIICIQEVLYEQFIVIKKALKYDAKFGANVTSAFMNYGIAIFSKYKIDFFNHVLLTSKKEQRGLLHIKVKDLNIINTHLGLDKRERIIQIDEILDFVSYNLGNNIICGDFNQENIYIDNYSDSATIFNKQNIKTFQSGYSRIDYIFVDKEYNIIDYYVDKVEYSDHYPVIVQIKINMTKE